jgi:hypothetical protein
MAGTIVADTIQAASTSTLVLKNGVANTPPTIQDSAGTQIGTFCRAWVNFDGTTNTGGFCTIRASFNVTSVADNGTGTYTVNLTNAMPDANYSVVLGLNAATDAAFIKLGKSAGIGVPTTLAFQVNTTNFSAVYTDYPGVFAAIFR